jgi:hypothetical protein
MDDLYITSYALFNLLENSDVECWVPKMNRFESSSGDNEVWTQYRTNGIIKSSFEFVIL